MQQSHAEKQKIFYDRKFKKLASERMESRIADFYFRKISAIIDEHSAVNENAAMLEVGVGSGIIMRKMADRFAGCTCKGIDISEKNVKKAQSKGLEVQVADANKLEIDGSYDFIYGVAVLHHLDDNLASLSPCLVVFQYLNSEGLVPSE